MSKILDNIMLKMGYVPKSELEKCWIEKGDVEYWLNREIEDLRAVKVPAIVRAIQGARIVTASLDNGYETFVAQDGEISPEGPSVNLRSPVRPEYYRLAVDIDMAVVRRVYEDLLSREVDFFVERMIDEIRNNLTALMRLRV